MSKEEVTMADTTARSWIRWQDWVTLVIGLYVALSPFWTTTSTEAMWSLIVLGGLLAVCSLWSLAMPAQAVSEWVNIAMGVLLFIAPWVIAYTTLEMASWTSWIAGGLAVLVSAYGATIATGAHHRAVGQH